MAALATPIDQEEPFRLGEVAWDRRSMPSPVDSRGVPVGMFLREWSGLALPAIMMELISRSASLRDEQLVPELSIRVAKDADLGALKAWQEHRDASPQDSLIFVKASNGIDAGLVCQGHLVTGSHGLAGQLGHMSVPAIPSELLARVGGNVDKNPPSRRCQRCTGRQCLEALASGGAILDQLRDLEDDNPSSLDELIVRVKEHGDDDGDDARGPDRGGHPLGARAGRGHTRGGSRPDRDWRPAGASRRRLYDTFQ